MDKIVIYDTETTNSSIWGSIIEFGAVVVDKNLKIHLLNNMFVVGSSVFPTGGHANPTLSIVKLSLKLSDHIEKIFKNTKICCRDAILFA